MLKQTGSEVNSPTTPLTGNNGLVCVPVEDIIPFHVWQNRCKQDKLNAHLKGAQRSIHHK